MIKTHKIKKFEKKKHVDVISFNSNNNIGLMMFCNDDFCLVPKEFSSELCKRLESILKVEIFKISIASTNLIGVFVNQFNKTLLLPNTINNDELNDINKILKKFNYNYIIFDSEFNCNGNNMLIHKNKAIINPDIPDKDLVVLKNAGLEIVKRDIAGTDITGAVCVINHSKGKALIHRDIDESELRFLENFFGIEIGIGTVNMGSPFIKAGIVCNKNGFVIGADSGGPEITNADQVLGFIDN